MFYPHSFLQLDDLDFMLASEIFDSDRTHSV